MADILKPFKLTDTIELRNRMVMAPMTTWSGQPDGQVSLEELDYYRYRSGGVGMVITGTTYTLPNGMGFENQFYAGDDLYIPSLRKLAQTIQNGGAKAVLQIFHAGRMSKKKILGGNQVVSASAVKAERENAEEPRELAEAEIHNIIDSFYETTRRAIEAGFDGVEIHGANTYLVQQFFSPHSNRRDDYWGGSLEKRLRFPIGIISSVQKAVADFADKNFIIGYRLSPEEVEEPGITIDDTLTLVDVLADQGLTYLNISTPRYDQTSMRDKDDKVPVGKKILGVINKRVPVLGVGGITTFEDANDAHNFGYDMVQLGRSIIMNPDWIRRVREGHPVRKVLDLDSLSSLYVPQGMLERILQNTDWIPVVGSVPEHMRHV